MSSFTMEDFTRLLRECAGEAEGTQTDAMAETSFEELGYDSIALLEVAARIQQEYGVRIEEEALPDLDTPRMLVDHVNRLPHRA
ncbi:acyl carrier protein [Streptomonospora arabica]|uniref:Acyl carrier protein n=1 Tax=Streptomonospora arabica TaxID=412417 RepID=A0ABV9SGJ3_9ACTN